MTSQSNAKYFVNFGQSTPHVVSHVYQDFQYSYYTWHKKKRNKLKMILFREI